MKYILILIASLTLTVSSCSSKIEEEIQTEQCTVEVTNQDVIKEIRKSERKNLVCCICTLIYIAICSIIITNQIRKLSN